MALKAHAEYSPSSSERWTNCYGSIQLCRTVPPLPESEYAKEGTDAHKCFEAFLRVANRKSPRWDNVRDFLLKTYPEEMVKHAEHLAALCLRDVRPNSITLVEHRVDISPFTKPGQFGSLDFAALELFGRLTIIDFKYGAGIKVKPEQNTQLICYALGLLYEYDWNFSEVEIKVAQPRIEDKSGSIRYWIASIEEMRWWATKMRRDVKRCEGSNPPFREGKWCFFCAAKEICPEKKKRGGEKCNEFFK